MKKKPTDWRQDIQTEINFMAAEERRKDDLIRGVVESIKKYPKSEWPDIIEGVEKVLKKFKSN